MPGDSLANAYGRGVLRVFDEAMLVQPPRGQLCGVSLTNLHRASRKLIGTKDNAIRNSFLLTLLELIEKLGVFLVRHFRLEVDT